MHVQDDDLKDQWKLGSPDKALLRCRVIETEVEAEDEYEVSGMQISRRCLPENHMLWTYSEPIHHVIYRHLTPLLQIETGHPQEN